MAQEKKNTVPLMPDHKPTCLMRVDFPPMFGPVTRTQGAWPPPATSSSSSPSPGQLMKTSLGMKSSPKKVLVTQGWREPRRSRKGAWEPGSPAPPGSANLGRHMGPSPPWL